MGRRAAALRAAAVMAILPAAVLSACGDGAGNGAGVPPGAADAADAQSIAPDTEFEEDAPPATELLGDTGVEQTPPCGGKQTGDPCSEDGAKCTDPTPWCGDMVPTYGCHCNGTVWQCYSAAAPLDCHECCQEAMGDMYFCQNGQCLAASGCAATDCCVPGKKGDAWCKASFGDCSVCGIVSGDGRCGPTDCGG